ncbi:MAG: hypothetical protein V4750_00425 [Pseudomonadota bacterium]
MRSPAPPLKNGLARGLLGGFAARALLALAFLFAQQTASLHWLSHAIDATHAKSGAGSAPAEHCDECLTLSALDAAAASHAGSLPIAAAQHPLRAPTGAAPSPTALRLAFRSRAPPILG